MRFMYVVDRETFDSESDAARAYDTALWRLKPREASNYVNFKDTCPTEVAETLAALEKVRDCEVAVVCCYHQICNRGSNRHS